MPPVLLRVAGEARAHVYHLRIARRLTEFGRIYLTDWIA
jgi:hypothetical protein